MWKNNKIIIFIICLCLFLILDGTLVQASGTAPSVWDLVRQSVQSRSQPETTEDNKIIELLDKFSQSRENMNSFIIESRQECKYQWETETEKHSGTMYFQSFIAYDGKRRKKTSSSWGNLGPTQTNISESNPSFNASLWDGERDYSYTRSESGNSSGYVIVTIPGDDEKDIITQSDYKRYVIGYANGEEERFDELLKENLSQVILRERSENIHGFDCYVIDADIDDRGEYHIWIDPEHDYHIVKMQVNRSENDLSYGNRIEKGYFTKETYEVSSFEKYGDVWFPKEFKTTSEKTTYGHPRSEERTFTFINVVFNPDFEALGTFKPDFINNGARVDIIDPIKTPDGKTVSVDGEFTWEDGKIVDNNGREVDIDNIGPISLIGQSLPSLHMIGITPDRQAIENRMLLLCFWDRDQRPSRNAVLSLNARAETLLEKDLYMIFVHAGPIDEQSYTSWLRENEILPPAGLCTESLEELGYIWGVKSLPWLILTDKNHVVTDEGFSINELDEKIQEIENAEK